MSSSLTHGAGERFALADIREVDHVGDLADLFELLAFAARLEKRFELHRHVKMVFDRVLAAPGHEQDVVDARGHRFFDAVLNDRLIDDRQHLFWLRLGGWQEAGTETSGGENGFADFSRHKLQCRAL